MADTPHTPEELEIAEEVYDRLRGGPRRKLMEFAESLDVSYEELMEHTRYYLESDEYWSEGSRFESVGLPEDFWQWYELVTGEVVPADKRWSFFSCSC